MHGEVVSPVAELDLKVGECLTLAISEAMQFGSDNNKGLSHHRLQALDLLSERQAQNDNVCNL